MDLFSESDLDHLYPTIQKQEKKTPQKYHRPIEKLIDICFPRGKKAEPKTQFMLIPHLE